MEITLAYIVNCMLCPPIYYKWPTYTYLPTHHTTPKHGIYDHIFNDYVCSCLKHLYRTIWLIFKQNMLFLQLFIFVVVITNAIWDYVFHHVVILYTIMKDIQWPILINQGCWISILNQKIWNNSFVTCYHVANLLNIS
jgi:hypothetical protein